MNELPVEEVSLDAVAQEHLTEEYVKNESSLQTHDGDSELPESCGVHSDVLLETSNKFSFACSNLEILKEAQGQS